MDLERRTWARPLKALAVCALVVATLDPIAAAAAPAPACKKNCGDTSAPAVSIISPTVGATIAGTARVSGSAADNVGVARVEVGVDGGSFQTATGMTSWSWSFPTNGYANGTHTITARATDTSGNTASKSVAVNVNNPVADSVAPSVSISSPAAGATVSGTTTVSGTASDNVGVARVEVAADSGPWQTATGTASWSWSWSTSAYGDGGHTLSARGTDSAGNVSAILTRSITVANSADTTPPTASVSAPISGSSAAGTVTVAGTAGDDVGLAGVDVSVDGGVAQTATGTTNWTWSWDSRAVANGTHTVSLQAVDTSNNVSLVTSTSVTVSNSPPTLSVCSDGSRVLDQTVTPEGVRIAICTTVGNWTTTSIYSLLQPNAIDLPVVGPHVTVQVQTGSPSSEGSSASCCDAAGRYYGYSAIIVLNPSASSSFSAVPDAIVAHEYGHAWTDYWYYMNPANNGSWAAYEGFRWAAGSGAQVLSQNPKLNTTYSWMDYEMAADDYRRLFGSPAAQSQLNFLNSEVPDSKMVTGLAPFFLDTWR